MVCLLRYIALKYDIINELDNDEPLNKFTFEVFYDGLTWFGENMDKMKALKATRFVAAP